MSGTNSSTGSGASRPPVTETQIPPPQIPPQALRPPTGATAAAAGTGTTSSGASATTAASTAQSAAASAVTGASPPGTHRARTASHSQPKTTPIPAPTVPLVQETPVPAPQIPGFNTSSSSSSGVGAAGSPPKETKVVPPVPPISSIKPPRPAVKTAAGLPQNAVKTEPSIPERKPQQQQQQRPWSPPRPPISPVLAPADMPPHLRPMATGSGTFYKTDFAAGRPKFKYTEAARDSAASIAHSEAHDQAAAAARAGDSTTNAADATAQLPPGPVPIDFSSNPDVLALSSTLSILQIQRKKALEDIRKLQVAKEAALANPAAFLDQLRNMSEPAPGRGPAPVPAPASSLRPSPASNSSTCVADKDGDVGMVGGLTATNTPNREMRRNSVSSSSSDESAAVPPGARPSTVPVVDLNNLPKPQNIVRMPHINWNQYGVVGDALDRVHTEQVRRPPAGQPAFTSVVQGDGRDEAGGPHISFDQVNFGGGGGGGAGGGGSGTRAVYSFNGYESAVEAAENAPLAPVYRGIAAPYDPLVDVIEEDQSATGHRSSMGSTPGETGPQSVFGASFSSAGTGAGTGAATINCGRGASVPSNPGAAQSFQFSTAPPREAVANNGPPAASTRRSKSSKVRR